MAWLINLLRPLISWLLSDLITYVVNAIKHWQKEKEVKAEREATAKEALEQYQKAGTSPELTPEQKAKEQEDAFKKLVNDLNREP